MSVKAAAGSTALIGALGIIVIAFSASELFNEMTAIRMELRDEMHVFKVINVAESLFVLAAYGRAWTLLFFSPF